MVWSLLKLFKWALVISLHPSIIYNELIQLAGINKTYFIQTDMELVLLLRLEIAKLIFLER